MTHIIQSTVDTVITPEMAAKAFAHFGSDGQAAFFEHLAAEVKATFGDYAYGHGEMQWCYLVRELQSRKGEGLAMYHALSCFAFEFAQDAGMLQQRSEF